MTRVSLYRGMTKAETDFVNEYTKKLIVGWARISVDSTFGFFADEKDQMFLDHAISKGWVDKQGKKVLAAGYTVAAAFLRR